MVVVEGRKSQAIDERDADSRFDSMAVEKQVGAQAVAAARDEVWLPGAVLCINAGMAFAWVSPPAASWSLVAAGWGAFLIAWRWAHRGGALALQALILVTDVVVVWPVWWASDENRVLLAAVAAVAGVAMCTAMAPWRPAVFVGALLPTSAMAVAQLRGSGEAWVAWLGAATLSALLLGLRLNLAWARTARSRLESNKELHLAQAARERAERTDQDKSRFLAIASHDLRQPVHALGLFAATLQKRLQHSADEPLARNLMQSVDELERSFNAILDISRLDGGAVVPHLQTFALRDVFRRLHMHYGGQAEFVGLALRFSPGGKSVTSDPQLLERVIGNLVHNAIKYTAKGGVAVVARTTSKCLNIEVWDTGCGISADELGHVFDEFYQIGNGERDRRHGLGMGLTIVKRLALVLGLRLEVASTPGRGTMFRVGVPAGGLSGMEEDMTPADTQPMAIETQQMVLIVDDEEPIREGLRLLLLEWGYQAMTATDGAQAEQVVKALEGRVDLVLSDLHLGGGADGQQVVANVRRLCGRDIPAILITGDTSMDPAHHVADSGDPVLIKPVQPRRLFDAMRAVLG